MKLSTGEFWAWLNSDDIYMPGTIFKCVKALQENSKVAMVYGDGLWINEDSVPKQIYKGGPLNTISLLTGSTGNAIPQATAFMRREALKNVGGLNEKLHMAMDYDLWIKLSFNSDLEYLPGPPLAGVRGHQDMKSVKYQLQAYLEHLQALKEGCRHPLCSHRVTPFRNQEYIKVYFGVARNYLEKNMWLKALPYLLRAVINAGFFYSMIKLFKRLNRKYHQQKRL